MHLVFLDLLGWFVIELVCLLLLFLLCFFLLLLPAFGGSLHSLLFECFFLLSLLLPLLILQALLLSELSLFFRVFSFLPLNFFQHLFLGEFLDSVDTSLVGRHRGIPFETFVF